MGQTAVVLDDQPLWLEAMGNLLDRLGMAVVGAVRSTKDALEAIEQHRPDVFVLDVGVGGQDDEMPCVHSQCAGAHGDLKVVALGSEATHGRRGRVRGRGIVFCVKSAKPDDLASAIRQAFDSRSTSHSQPRNRSGRTSANNDGGADLTRRELEILQLVAEGLQQLAARQDAVGDRADGEVPPVEHLPEARCREQDRGKSLGAAERPVVRRVPAGSDLDGRGLEEPKRAARRTITPGPSRFPAAARRSLRRGAPARRRGRGRGRCAHARRRRCTAGRLGGAARPRLYGDAGGTSQEVDQLLGEGRPRQPHLHQQVQDAPDSGERATDDRGVLEARQARARSRSAIWIAFSAAPLRRLSQARKRLEAAVGGRVPAGSARRAPCHRLPRSPATGTPRAGRRGPRRAVAAPARR